MAKEKEIDILAHDEQPGYRPAFYILFSLGVIYLLAIFLS